MKISIVTTLYHSSRWLLEFYKRMTKTVLKISEHYELIFVNDGSLDNSLELAVALSRKDERVCVIDLTRNFGHHKAMMTGLAYASGDLVFLIDCDLEEKPEWLEEFRRVMEESSEDVDIVFGVQCKRKGNWLERTSGFIFYNFFNILSDTKIPRDQTVARLMTRRYVKSLIQFTENELVFIGLCELSGYNQRPLYVEKGSKGTSTYNLAKKIDMAINQIVSFSSKPLILIFYLGLAVIFISMCYATKLIYSKLVIGTPLPGWSSIIISIWFLGGLLIFCVGVLGIYLSKIFIEVKGRPYTLIRTIYGERKDNKQ